MKRFIITEEEKSDIKKMYGLLNEQTGEEIRNLWNQKFPCAEFGEYTKDHMSKEGDLYVFNVDPETKYTWNPNENFYFYVHIAGDLKGLKVKYWCENDSSKYEKVQDSDLKIEIKEKLPNYPCVSYDWKDGTHIINNQPYMSWRYGNGVGKTYFNVNDGTFFKKGGDLDGQKGKVVCNGTEYNVEITTQETRKKVTNRAVPDSARYITKEYPLIYGMRDNELNDDDSGDEYETGLIYRLQKLLKKLNLYTGELDGQFGPNTLSAVKKFQKQNNLTPDGKVGPKTVQALSAADDYDVFW